MNNKQMTKVVKFINFMNSWIVILKTLDHENYRLLWERNGEYQARDYNLEQIAMDAQCQFNDPAGLMMVKNDLSDSFSNCRDVLRDYPKHRRCHLKQMAPEAKGWFSRSLSNHVNDPEVIRDYCRDGLSKINPRGIILSVRHDFVITKQYSLHKYATSCSVFIFTLDF